MRSTLDGARAAAARLAMALAVAGSGCGAPDAADDGPFVEDGDPMSLAWVSPGATLAVGEPIAMAVSTQNPAALVVRFALDGDEVGACDSASADDDCHDDALWQWTTVTDTPGPHTLTAMATTATERRVATARRVARGVPGGRCAPCAHDAGAADRPPRTGPARRAGRSRAGRAGATARGRRRRAGSREATGARIARRERESLIALPALRRRRKLYRWWRICGQRGLR